jgi:Tfp pilus assembly protein PilV
MVECIVALFLTVIAVLTLVNMQPLAWQGAGKSDYLGRAAGILQRELETKEHIIMRGGIPVNGKTCSDQDGVTVLCEDQSAFFSIVTTTSTPATIPAHTSLLNIKVIWPGNQNGLTSSVIVSVQETF